MNFRTLLPASVRQNIVSFLGGSFDGATNNPQRSSTLFFPMDSRQEIHPHERKELVKKHRSLRNNLGVVRGIINTTARLAIGKGLKPLPKSGDVNFDARALAYFLRFTSKQSWSIDGQDTDSSMQRLVLKEVMVDGEMFAVKVLDGFGKYQRQLIKTEQIGAPRDVEKAQDWQDGVLINGVRRPLAYGVKMTAKEEGRAVAARNMIHVYDRERAMQMRGLPWGYTGLNHGVDMLDIVAFEKISHKLNAAIVGSVQSTTGDVPAAMNAMLAAAKEAQAMTQEQTSADRTREGARFLDLHGTSIPIFKAGEGMNFYGARNSVSVTDFAGWLAAQYAQGFGLPIELVVGMATGSASVRGNMELAGRFFEDVQQMMIDDWCQPNWENIIGTGILASRYPKDFPGVEPLEPPRGWNGWDVCEWRGPRNVTIDKGRDGKLLLELKRAGWMTDEEWWTAMGGDAEKMSRQVDEDIAKRRARWVEEMGLPEDMFWRKEFGQGLPAGAGMETAAPAASVEE